MVKSGDYKKSEIKEKVVHTLRPVYDKDSKVLILGSIPSPKSREYGFYYGHERNRFWKIMARVFEEKFPESIEEKKQFILKNKLALWDVLAECSIHGASDQSIESPVPNDISGLIKETDIGHIFTTGRKAYELYTKLSEQSTGIKAICLPSTSPANCACTEERLYEAYLVIKTAAEAENHETAS